MSPPDGDRLVILVDGTCVFCNRLVARVMRMDKKKLFRFAHTRART